MRASPKLLGSSADHSDLMISQFIEKEAKVSPADGVLVARSSFEQFFHLPAALCSFARCSMYENTPALFQNCRPCRISEIPHSKFVIGRNFLFRIGLAVGNYRHFTFLQKTLQLAIESSEAFIIRTNLPQRWFLS